MSLTFTYIVVNKLLRFLVVTWALVAGLTACRDYDFDLWQSDDAAAPGDSAYMSFSFAIAGEKGVPTRSTARESRPENVPDFGPYSYTWEEEGNDPINKVVIYVFKEKDGAFSYEKTKTFQARDLELSDGTWRLKEPFNTTAGKKKVFVVVNPTASVETNIANKLTPVAPATQSEYESFDKFSEYLHSSGVHTFTTDSYPTSRVATSRADELVTNGGILMTGEAVEATIAAGVKKQTVQSTAANNPKVTVERAAARVLVTMPNKVDVANFDDVMRLGAKGLNEKQIIRYGDDAVPVAYATDITWRVAQGAKDFYFIKKGGKDQTFTLASYFNPKWSLDPEDPGKKKDIVHGPDTVHVSLPTEEMPNPPEELPEYDGSGTPIIDIWNEVYPHYARYTESFDYSGLWKTPKRPVQRDSIAEPTGYEHLDPDWTDEENRVTGEKKEMPDSPGKLNKEKAEGTYIKREKEALRSLATDKYEYVLPTSTGLSQYANNAYVIIKAKIIPLVWFGPNEDGDSVSYSFKELLDPDIEVKPSYDAEGGFYYQPYNSNGGLPSFSTKPVDTENTVNIYLKGGYAYWCVPINPSNRFRRLRNGDIIDIDRGLGDDDFGPYFGADCAPIMRNTYYHLQIGTFRRIGLNWNPFVPYPATTITYASDNPHNPDSRPQNDPEQRLPAYLPNDALKNNAFKYLIIGSEGSSMFDKGRKDQPYKGE